jgi:uncharacterized protein (TIGR00156 family)
MPYGATGGFNGPMNANLSDTNRAKRAWDDTYVSLKGRIIAALGDERYTFQDDVGVITVKISNKRWHGRQVSPTDVVVIHGEVDREFHHVEVEVKNFEVLR